MRLGASIAVAVLIAMASTAGAQQTPPGSRTPQPQSLVPQKQSPARQGDQGITGVPAVPVQKVESTPLSPPDDQAKDERKETLEIQRQAAAAEAKAAEAVESLVNATNQLVASGDRLVTATNALGGFTHGLIVVGTVQVVVLVLQVVMFLWQLLLIKKGTARAETSARSASESANLAKLSFTKLERAFIAGGGSPSQDRKMFRLVVHNGGRTPGEITKIGMGWCAAGNPPNAPDYTEIRFVAWIPPGVRDHPLTLIDLSKIRRETPPPGVDVNIYGRIFYNDIFGDPHSFGFFTTARASGESFVTPNPPRAYVVWD